MEQLFTREGAEFIGSVEFNDKGKPVYTRLIPCDRCAVFNGQRIWCRWVENGQPRSNTGFDCWKCGNTGIGSQCEERLYTAAELAKVQKAAATRAARKEAERIATEERIAAENQAREQKFYVDNSAFIEALNTLDGDFWVRFREQFLVRQLDPTERQIELVNGAVAKRAANTNSRFVGAVGNKVTLALTVERIITLFSEFYGNNYLWLCRDQNGNVVTYRGRVDLGDIGSTVTVTATIKEHQWYGDVQQTLIQRPKVV